MPTILRALALALALIGLAAGPAASAPVESEHFHEVFSEPMTDCGVEAQGDFDIKGSFTFNPRTGLYRESVGGSVIWTNLETGKTFTEVFHNNSRDAEIIDNGDGTLTVTVQAAGGYYSLDNDGKIFLRDPGVTRFRVLVDAETGDFLDFLGDVKESTGLNELEGHDFCEDFLLVTG